MRKFTQIGSFLDKGRVPEKAFASIFNRTEPSTKEQDIFEHFDLSIKVDVKGLKKINRSDEKPNEQFHYIEIKNVNGKVGWMYGKADFFAFETNDYWILVGKKQLQELIAEKCAKKEKGRGIYQLRQREGRQDLITIVPTLDLCYISTEIICKNKNKD